MTPGRFGSGAGWVVEVEGEQVGVARRNFLPVLDNLMTYHKPVLLKEVVAQLRPRSRGLYVDCTVGGGGHAAEIFRASAPDGRLIGLDWDEEAIPQARERLSEFGGRVQLVSASYVELDQVLMSMGVTTVEGVLFDLGVELAAVRRAVARFQSACGRERWTCG